MNRVAKIGGVITGLGAIAVAALWLLKDRITGPAPAPVAPSDAPRFRVAPPPPVQAPAAADDLSAVKGIGPVFKARLATAGITTFAGLAAADPEVVAEYIGASHSQVEDWISQAAALAG